MEEPVTEAFAELVAKERERLTKEGDSLDKRIADLEEKRAANRRELAALDAYEATKNGTQLTPTKPKREPTTRGPRRGGIRDKVLQALDGKTLRPPEIRQAVGIQDDDKSGVQSVANALSALKKANSINVNQDGAYSKNSEPSTTAVT